MSEPAKQIPVRSGHFADENDLECAVRKHGAAMLSVARQLLVNEDDARECVQEAYLLAFAKISTFEGRSSSRTWLHRIVRNGTPTWHKAAALAREWELNQLAGRLEELADG